MLKCPTELPILLIIIFSSIIYRAAIAAVTCMSMPSNYYNGILNTLGLDYSIEYFFVYL